MHWPVSRAVLPSVGVCTLALLLPPGALCCGGQAPTAPVVGVSCLPHAQSSLEFFVPVSSFWDVCQQEATRYRHKSPHASCPPMASSERSAQAAAKRETTHLSIGSKQFRVVPIGHDLSHLPVQVSGSRPTGPSRAGVWFLPAAPPGGQFDGGPESCLPR